MALDWRIKPNSVWARHNIQWARAEQNPPRKGKFYLTVCFFDYTAFVGRVSLDYFYQTIEQCCNVIDGFTLEDAYELFEQEFGDYDFDGNNTFSSIAFEISDYTNGINRLIAETGMYLPKD